MAGAEETANSPGMAGEPAQLSPVAKERDPEEKARQRKHTRVHKREKELYGLITPVFLPLLDARDTSPTKKKEKKQPKLDKVEDASSTARDAEKGKESRKTRRENKDIEGAASGEPASDMAQPDASKKLRRSVIKKSSLRHNNTPRTRRKRVSLVIDGQTVLPADTVLEPSLMSPSSETTSASNSTTSIEEMIDPRLTGPDTTVHVEHHDAVHHSLPLPMSNTPMSPTKPLTETPSPIITTFVSHSPPDLALRSPSIPFGPPQTATRTFLDPSPAHPSTIPETAGPDPIYPSEYLTSPPLADDELAEESHFDTYVGGLHGSGVDDVDQAGSYGYPSSLGASYLESYMQGRPLSVRMQAADKAGLDEREKRDMVMHSQAEKDKEMLDDDDFDMEMEAARARDADDELMGNMEGF